MAVIKSGASTDTLTVDPTSKSARTTLYGPDGSVISRQDKSAITPGTQSGVLLSGSDGRVARLARSMSDGSLADGRPTVQMFDPVEGAAVNINTWLQTTTTMTITQASGSITLNANNTATTTTGAMHLGAHLVLLPSRGRITFRSRQRHTAHFANNLIELGYFTPSSATAAQIGTGAIWRKDSGGQYVPVISVNNAETTGTPISNATFLASIPTTNYAFFEVELDEAGAWFRILTTEGALVNEQRVDLPTATPDWQVTHFTPGYRTYNVAATGTAVQALVAETGVYSLDVYSNKPWGHQMSGNGWHSAQSPTAYTQAATYVNNTGATAAAASNTTPRATGLGGHAAWNATATSENDLLIFSYQVPSPYSFYLTGVRISTINLGAAVASTPSTIGYSLATNSTADSLATIDAATARAPRFIPLGYQSAPVGAAIGAVFDRDTVWTPATPVCIQPGRFVQLAARMVIGTATLSQTIRTICAFDGYFE